MLFGAISRNQLQANKTAAPNKWSKLFRTGRKLDRVIGGGRPSFAKVGVYPN
jgi:hypothetical protein